MTPNPTNLTALTEVIQKARLEFSDSVVTGTLPKGHNDLTKLIAQRILDAGWRRVPGVEEMVKAFHDEYLKEHRMNAGIQAIHDLMTKGE